MCLCHSACVWWMVALSRARHVSITSATQYLSDVFKIQEPEWQNSPVCRITNNKWHLGHHYRGRQDLPGLLQLLSWPTIIQSDSRLASSWMATPSQPPGRVSTAAWCWCWSASWAPWPPTIRGWAWGSRCWPQWPPGGWHSSPYANWLVSNWVREGNVTLHGNRVKFDYPILSAGSLVHMSWVPPIILHLVLVVTGLLGLVSSLLSAGPGCRQHCGHRCQCCPQVEEPPPVPVTVTESALQEGESQGNRYARFPWIVHCDVQDRWTMMMKIDKDDHNKHW